MHTPNSKATCHMYYNRVPIPGIQLFCKIYSAFLLQGLQAERRASLDDRFVESRITAKIFQEIEDSFKIIDS